MSEDGQEQWGVQNGYPFSFSFFEYIHLAWVFSSGQSEVLAHASSSWPVQQDGKKQARIPRDVGVYFLR